jgi:hypothetical protein
MGIHLTTIARDKSYFHARFVLATQRFDIQKMDDLIHNASFDQGRWHGG